jgi:hypothetical protein
LRAIRRFRRQIAAGAQIQTNTSSFATFRIFLYFSWICFHGKELVLFERITFVSVPKVSYSFLQNAKGYQLPAAKSKKIRGN